MSKLKLFLLLLFLLTIISILRETGVLTIDRYQSKITLNTSTSFEKSFTTVTIDKKTLHGPFESRDYSDLGIVVLFKGDTIFKEINKKPAVIVTVLDIDYGMLWTPFYKNSAFTAVGNLSINQTVIKVNGDKLSSTNMRVSGNLTFKGHASIVGVCSYRTSKNLVRNNVMVDAIRSVRQYLASLDTHSQVHFPFPRGLPADNNCDLTESPSAGDPSVMPLGFLS